MKIKRAQSFIAALVITSALLAGCSKQNEPQPVTAQPPPGDAKPSGSIVSDAQKTVTTTAGAVQDAAQKLAGDAATAGQKQASELAATAQKQAADAAAAVQAKAQGIIDQAKAFVAEKKFPEALATLQQKLASLQLTPAQQQVVDGLKEQIQKALGALPATDPTKAAGDVKKLLGK